MLLFAYETNKQLTQRFQNIPCGTEGCEKTASFVLPGMTQGWIGDAHCDASDVLLLCSFVRMCTCLWVNKVTSPARHLAGARHRWGFYILFCIRVRVWCCWWSWNNWNLVCQHPLWSLSVTSGALWPPAPSKLRQTCTQNVSLTPSTTRRKKWPTFLGTGTIQCCTF